MTKGVYTSEFFLTLTALIITGVLVGVGRVNSSELTVFVAAMVALVGTYNVSRGLAKTESR